MFWLDCTSDLSSSWKTDTLDIGVRVPGSPKIPKVPPPPHPGLTGYLPDAWINVQYVFPCSVVTCPALPTPSNGTRQGCSGASTEIYNTVCQFSCNPGFVSLGSPFRTCLQNGSWSGQDFVCQGKNIISVFGISFP